MTRLSLTENMRQLRVSERRDPVDSAVYALASLSKGDRGKFVERFNKIFDNRPYGMRVNVQYWRQTND